MIGFVVCLLSMLLLQLLWPFWWWIMAVPFGWFLWRGGAIRPAVATGAASAGVLWLAAAAWLLSAGESDLIAIRVAKALGVGSPWALVFIAGLTAAVAGGLAAAAGTSLAALRRSRKATGRGDG